MSLGSLRLWLLAGLFSSVSALTPAQTWNAGSQARDVWWIDEETTTTSSPALTAEVVNLDKASTPSGQAKSAAKVEPASGSRAGPTPARKPGEVSDLLTGRKKTVSTKPAEKTPKPAARRPASNRSDDETPRARQSRPVVTRTGSVLSVQPVENNNLQVIIETSEGTLVEGLVSPHLRVRVPDKGARVRMRGALEGSVEGTESVRVFDLERLGPRASSREQPPVRRPVRPVAPPPYGYPVW